MADKLAVMKPVLFSGEATGAIGIFGYYKGNTGTPSYSDDPDDIQGYTGATGRTGLTGQNAWTEGWNAAVDANKAPTIQDVNAFFYTIMYQLCYIFQEGISHYMATKEYHKNSFVKCAVGTTGSTGSTGVTGLGATGSIYISLANTNTGNPLSDESKWAAYYPNKVTKIGYNYTVAWDDYIIRWSLATTSATQKTITLPTPSAANVNRELIILVSSSIDGANNVQFVNGPTGVTLKKSHTLKFKCTGTEWLCVTRFYFT